MPIINRTTLTLVILIGACTIALAEKPRVIVPTHIGGGDLDDYQSEDAPSDEISEGAKRIIERTKADTFA